MNCTKRALLLLCLLSFTSTLFADQIKVAVASNFVVTLRALAEEFELRTGHQVLLITGSTGKLYAQISQGAPYDAFFAADARRPEILEREGGAIEGSRFTYASGRVVLWSPDSEVVDSSGEVLKRGKFKRLSIANPKLAPYGRAAQQILQKRGIWQSLRTKVVRGENIGQAYQFVRSGSVELGFVAFSQLKRPTQPISGSYWLVPQQLYQPILQQAVLLKEGVAANAFMEFVKSDYASAVIGNSGYFSP